MSDPDELFTLRTLFWLGSFQVTFISWLLRVLHQQSKNISQAAINEATGLTKVPSALLSEKDEYIYRSFLAMGQYGVVLSEIKERPSTSLGTFLFHLINTFFLHPAQFNRTSSH